MITIQLKKAQEIFHNKFTKARIEDFLRIAIENKDRLSPKEFIELSKMYDKMHNKDYSNGFEFMIERQKGKIKLIRFDD